MATKSGSLAYLLLVACAAALGGLLFGYDTAVVSGAIGFLKTHFELGADLEGLATSSMLIGCMVGAMMAGPLGDRFGRKKSLLACAVLFALSALATGIPNSLGEFLAARFAGGLAIGAASMLSPLYIAEIAPERIRGTLVTLYQLAIVIGILVVFFVNLQIQRLGDEAWNVEYGWRWMFASLVLPSALFGLFMAFVPESPRWLMKMGRAAEARAVLESVGGEENANREMLQIENSLRQEEGRWHELWSSGYRMAMMVGIGLAILSQFSGINAIMYYAPEIFKGAGSETDAAFQQTVVTGAVNLLFTFIAIWWIDIAGRKLLLLIGTAGQAVFLGMVGWALECGGAGWPLLVGILGFVASFAMAMGPISWVVISEIFPNKLRGRAMAVTILFLWFADWVVTQTFPMLRDSEQIGMARTFWIYAVCSAATFLFIALYVPETKGRTLEEIEASWRTIKDPCR